MTTPAQRAAEKLQERGCLRHPLSEQTVAAIISAAYLERDSEIKRVMDDALKLIEGPQSKRLSESEQSISTQLREAIGKL